MKKLLLFLLLIFSAVISAQTITTPPNITLCDTGFGYAEVDLSMQTSMILGAQSPNDYTVSYHSTMLDAQNDLDPLPQVIPVQGSMVVFIRLESNANPANYALDSFVITVMPGPPVTEQVFTQCDYDNNPSDGLAFVDLSSIMEQIWWQSGTSPNDTQITFYLTYNDAQAQVNPLATFSNTTQPQVIYAVCQSMTTGCISIIPVQVSVLNCSDNCLPPQNIVITSVTETTAVVDWTAVDQSTEWEVLILPIGVPAPLPTANGETAYVSPYMITGLSCGTLYDIYVRAHCNSGNFGAWSQPVTFSTGGCQGPGQPVNLAECTENGTACFDLTVNTENVIGNLDSTEYTVTYHMSYADAAADIGAITNASNYCVPVTMASPEIYIRLENNATGDYTIYGFAITAQEVVAGNISIQPMVECDDDGNGAVVFNLTTVAAQLNTANGLTFYEDSQDAVAGVNAITNPTSVIYNVGVSAPIFIRENVIGSCDIIYSMEVIAVANCSVATVCAAANSLCNSLGVPFANTTNGGNAEPGNDYNCLGSQPNPTWFFVPISSAGSLQLTMSQVTNSGQPIDLDYICYGPYSNPVTPCSGMLTGNYIVGCSFSTAAVESVMIQNAQPGQYYLLMVTNFSNQAGTITISQTSGTAEIDCTGMRLNAFIDANGNGAKDSGEQNFPLGQFHFEKNNDGNVHNITAPTGVYNLYDINSSSSYDLSFTVDAAYAGNYSVTTPAYSNVNPISGGGMQTYLFPVTVTQTYNDLAVYIVPNQAPRPGFQYSNKILYTNLGTQTTSGTVTFAKDPAVSIVAVSQAGTVSNANGFTYSFSGLQPFEVREINVTMQVPTIPTVAIGQLLTNHATITPIAGDVSPSNNESLASQIIIGSYDPNDKMESHGERILFSDFGTDDYLYYTIRFENTGTAEAINVRISDILDQKLDETSVRMVSASHDYVLDRVDNQLSWRFDNIELPTTTQDPMGGKGYVYFKVKPKAGYAVGDIIPNTASIFFDFNPAIVTNTFHTEFVPTLATGEFAGGSFAIYPNPAGDNVTVSLNGNSGSIDTVTIYDMLGKRVLSQKSGVRIQSLDVSAISPGIYLIEVTCDANLKTSKKLVIK